jgi:hypothetical protein
MCTCVRLCAQLNHCRKLMRHVTCLIALVSWFFLWHAPPVCDEDNRTLKRLSAKQVEWRETCATAAAAGRASSASPVPPASMFSLPPVVGLSPTPTTNVIVSHTHRPTIQGGGASTATTIYAYTVYLGDCFSFSMKYYTTP